MFGKKKKEIKEIMPKSFPLVGRVYDHREQNLTLVHITHIHDYLVVYDIYKDGIMETKGRLRSFCDFEKSYDTSQVVCFFKNVKDHFEASATRAEMKEKIDQLKRRVIQLEQDKAFLEGKTISTEME